MSEPSEREEAAPSDPTDAPGPSPFRSVAAVVGGWLSLYVLWMCFGALVARLAPSEVGAGGAAPTIGGMGILLAGMFANGVLAGLVTGRLAGSFPLAHAAVLGGLIGWFGMLSSDAARGLPWWFAVGRALVPAVSITLGGAIAALRARRAAPR